MTATYKTTLSNLRHESMTDVVAWIISCNGYTDLKHNLTEDHDNEVIIADEHGVLSACVLSLDVKTNVSKEEMCLRVVVSNDEYDDEIYIRIGSEWLCFTKVDLMDYYEEVIFTLTTDGSQDENELVHEVVQMVLSNNNDRMEMYPSKTSRLYGGEITNNDFELTDVSIVKNMGRYKKNGPYTVNVNVLIPASLLRDVYELTIIVSSGGKQAKLVGFVD